MIVLVEPHFEVTLVKYLWNLIVIIRALPLFKVNGIVRHIFMYIINLIN